MRVTSMAKQASEYIHVARCPACGVVLDELRTPTPELPGIAEAMLLGSSRQAHGEASPSCAQSDAWVIGWIIDPPKPAG